MYRNWDWPCFCTSKTGLIPEAHGGNSSCESLSSPHPFTLLLLTSVSKWRISHARAEVILSVEKSRETSGHIQNGKLVEALIFLFIGYYFLDKIEALFHCFYVVLIFSMLPPQGLSPSTLSPGYAPFLSSCSHSKIQRLKIKHVGYTCTMCKVNL